MKQFVKAKPLGQPKQKQPPPYPRENKKNNKKYQQKSFPQQRDPREHIKSILNEYKPLEKSPIVLELCRKFPKIFSERSLKPQPQFQGNFSDFLWHGNKKQIVTKTSKPMSSDSSDPDWASDEDKQVNLASKKIDDNIVEKINTLASKQLPKKLDQLQRYEKQFLEDYYKQKRIEQHQHESSTNVKNVKEHEQKQQRKDDLKHSEIPKKKQQEEDWAEYDPNVGALITGGFIEKIEKGQDDDFEMDEDFSYQSQKSCKSSSSSDGDDDMFADQGPRTVTKTKEDKHHETEKKEGNKAIVKITSHIFSQIAEQVGLHPEACVWIISNKTQRFRVSTQYMNEYYKNGGLSAVFPYVSLNHSQFVHNDEIQTERALQKFKRYNERRRPKNYSKTNNNMGNSNQNKVLRPQLPHYKQKK